MLPYSPSKADQSGFSTRPGPGPQPFSKPDEALQETKGKLMEDCIPEKELHSGLHANSLAHLQVCSKTPLPRSSQQREVSA